MHTAEQPAGGMSAEYDARADSIADGHGILIPDDQDPSNTSLLAHAPGYSIFLGTVYSLIGRSYYRVQFIQNAINSITPIVLFFFSSMLLGWRVGAVSGFLAALSHHFSYYSNFILPDSLCALPLLVAIYLLGIAGEHRNKGVQLYAGAGLMIGLSIWLRANALLLGPFLALIPMGATRQRLRHAIVLAAVSLLTIAPITIRNYLVYGRFVPVQLGAGIVLWEGIGEAGGREFGAVVNDNEVAAQEALWYDKPVYANTWQTPDGIERDRDRVRRSFAVIRNHPFWYAGAVINRMGDMLKYSAQAPLVYRSTDTAMISTGERARREIERKTAPGKPLDPNESAGILPGRTLAFGRSLVLTRPAVRALQRLTKETMLAFVLIGLLLALVLSRRRALVIGVVPLYYLLIQGTMHTEFRYTLPMQYFVFVFAAITWVVIVAGIIRIATSRFRRRSVHLM